MISEKNREPEPETRSEYLALELFKERFPEQYKYRVGANLWGGYFAEWVYRFNKPDPTVYMDSQTLRIYKEILKDEGID